MANVDRPLSPGVFAADAQTTVPANPVPGVPYRDPVNGTSTIRQGWPFQRLVNSAEFNEVMYRITALLDVVNKTAGLAWSEEVDYQGPGAAQAPSFVASTDGNLYVALQASGPNSGGPKDPATGNTAYWSQFSGLAAGADVGDVKAVATEQPPFGWLKCNGEVVSRTQYPALFEAIGTRFGAGNGSTTFGLPDLRGDFVRGWDDGRGVDTDRVLGSSQEEQLLSHSHMATSSSAGVHGHAGSSSAGSGSHGHTGSAVAAGGHAHTVASSVNNVATGYGEQPAAGALTTVSTSSGGDHGHTLSIDPVGDHTHALEISENGDHQHVISLDPAGGAENLVRNIALLYVIKY